MNDVISEKGETHFHANRSENKGLRPSLAEMQSHCNIFKTRAAQFDEPGELLFDDPYCKTKWLLHSDNVPTVTPGIQTFNDLQQLGQGIFGSTLESLSKKDAVNQSFLQLGPILDTAVNYCQEKVHNADGQGLINDIHSAGKRVIQGAAESIENTASNMQDPLTQREIGKDISAASGSIMLLGKAGKLIELAKDCGIKVTSATGALGESIWSKGWSVRGFQAEGEMGNSGLLARNFPTIDDVIFKDGVVTSMKSIDLNAATYQNMEKLERRLNNCLDKMSNWNGQRQGWGGIRIAPNSIDERVLHFGIPNGSLTHEQAKVFENVGKRAKSLGVQIKLTVIE